MATLNAGREVDGVLNDPISGIFGLGTGWELPLIALNAYRRGEMPDDSSGFIESPAIPGIIEAYGRGGGRRSRAGHDRRQGHQPVGRTTHSDPGRADMIGQENGRLWQNDRTWGVTMDRTFDVPVDALWDWVTNPDRLVGWYCPVTGTLAPDGSYRMHFGDETRSGVIQRCDPPYGFTATWDHEGEPASLLTVTLAEDGPDGSRLTVEHERLPDDQAAGHAAGWHSYLDRLGAAVLMTNLPDWWPRWEEVIDGYREQHANLVQ